MSDNINDPLNAASAAAAPDETSQPVAFCQDCGRPLTRDAMRTVGAGVFCEPCLQVRLAGGIPAAVPPPSAATGTLPPIPGEPSPAVAGLLGLMPGVGAMYNGQFAKGIAHIAIFAILVSLSNHVSDIFGFVVAGWYCYMVFDAIHTARARRDGLPLPNTFGLNDIGERVAAGRWAPQQPPQSAPGTSTPPPASTAAQAGWSEVPTPPPAAPVPPPNAAAYANWAGYVPPAAFGAPPVAAAPTPASTPYSSVYTPPPAEFVPPPAPVRRFPVAAIVLVAFGVLFLIANIVPSWHFSERWAVPLVLAIWAAWVLARRIGHIDQLRSTAVISGRPYIVAVVRIPLILATLSLMFILQNLNVATMVQTWPLLLIVIGGLALIDRAAAYTPHPGVPVSTSVVPPVAEAPRADFTNGGEVR